MRKNHIVKNLLLMGVIAVLIFLWLWQKNHLPAGLSGVSPQEGESVALPLDVPLPLGSDKSPEPQLGRIFSEIEARRLDKAMQLTEDLIERYPNFRLAHLIKGDLLLAHALPLSAFGAAQGASSSQVEDLREEALVRLRAYKNRPPGELVPAYLLQMPEDLYYAVVIDAAKSRLYLYKNDNGFPRLITDYYVAQGKLGTDKIREGDKRTPIGVYHITSSLPREKLADLYGHGAFPLNYPNEWDRREGRGGSGIWLHGTPSNTFSRPPKASDGCVVLTNPDFDDLGKYVQTGRTPVIISNGVKWLPPDGWQKEKEALAGAIESWRNDWESLDIDRYLGHYWPDFRGADQGFEEFSAQKRRVHLGKSWVKVKLNHLSVFLMPDTEEVAVVDFEQVYSSNNLNNAMKKRQYWRRKDGRWKIAYEGQA